MEENFENTIKPSVAFYYLLLLLLRRLALQHGDGHVVEYLSQPVIDYILQTQLYITASG